MDEKLPKVISEGIMKLGDLEIKVCVLDDGRRIIPEKDFKRAIEFLGLNDLILEPDTE